MVNKSIFLSLLLIGVVAASAGAGTWATFSDTETSAGNTFTAGTLDLKVAGADSIPVVLEDVYPGKTGSTTVPVTNNGDIDGNLTLFVENLAQNSSEHNGVTGDFADSTGNLDAEMTFTVTSPLTGVAFNNKLSEFPSTGLILGTLGGGVTANITVGYVVSPDAGNNIQGDSTTFDLKLMLVQSV
ncbi:TasA family protein [Methanococcoides seepicolus]|uniref:SipW-dependent-type signal peptide-containing protein n=1 Tax=Methanococcoides seepicolus TaxID=2828780 RepID=A0A9E4ZFU3_9EURY|nr:TasA family protein [Methanococcoides seepicolus]MCM1987123.1 SipW-dependent-type signal peptide-containing protein [Methanococcoides seepicolus]